MELENVLPMFLISINNISVACGNNHTIVITEDGQVYSCGNNDCGQLGHEKPTKRLRNVFL